LRYSFGRLRQKKQLIDELGVSALKLCVVVSCAHLPKAKRLYKNRMIRNESDTNLKPQRSILSEKDLYLPRSKEGITCKKNTDEQFISRKKRRNLWRT
jgi:hypothetical protein